MLKVAVIGAQEIQLVRGKGLVAVPIYKFYKNK